MIASRFSWPTGTLFSKQNKKKRQISGSSSTSLQQLKKLILRRIFNNHRYTLLINIVKKNEPVHQSRKPEKPIMEK